ncbi:MAG: SGNH/GDSL hydrolase family protein [Polyangiaceae bacterium]
MAFKKRVKDFAKMAGITLVMSAVLGECGLRIIGFENPDFYDYDARVGWKHKPNMSAWQRQEGEALIETNSQGFRDREHTFDKPPGTVRVAVLGDSFTEAHQVSFDEMFSTKLGTKLASCNATPFAGKKVEVLNFGASSYGTTNELMLLRDEVLKYHPDFVLLAFTTGNDLEDNVYALAGAKVRPYVKVEGGKVVPDFSHNQPLSAGQNAWHKAQSVSRLVQFIQRYRMVRAARKRLATAGGNLTDVGLSDAMYKPPVTPEWEEAWSLAKAMIVAMNEDVKAAGGRFVFTTTTTSIQAHPDKATRDAFMAKLGVTDLFYADRELASFATKNGIPAITLSPPLQEYATKNNACLHGFSNSNPCAGHWNAKGHEVASTLLAEGICEASRPPSGK